MPLIIDILGTTVRKKVLRFGTEYRKAFSKEGREVPRKGNIPKREVLPDPGRGEVVKLFDERAGDDSNSISAVS